MPVIGGSRRARLALAFSVVAFSVSSIVVASAAVGADGVVAASFDGYAQGNALDATVSNSSLPLGLVIEAVGPEASSHLNSLGQSDAEASFPYLGTVVPGLPGVLGAIVGLPVPSYPLEATTGSGDRPKDVAFPGIALHAESGTRSTVASATVGSEGAGGATSRARVDLLSNGDAVAVADTAINALKLGGILSLTGIHSTVEVTADGFTGHLVRRSALSIGRISVPGLSIDVPKTTPGTVPIPIPVPGVPQLPPIPLPKIPLPFGGTHLPEPDIGFEDGTFTVTLPGFGTQRFAIPASTVLSAFKSAGIEMSFQPAVKTTTGMHGAQFSFTYTAPSPPTKPYFSGPTPITFTVGKAVASVTLRPAGATTSGGGALPSFGGGNSGGVTTPVGSSGNPTGSVGTIAGGGGSAIPPPALAPGGGQPSSGNQVMTVAGNTLGANATASDLYLAFVLVAVAAFVAITTLRLLGVRALWNS